MELKQNPSEPTLLRKIYNFFSFYWKTTVLIQILPGIFLIVIEIAGQSLFLITNGALTLLGHFIFWPVLLISCSFSIIKSFADRYNNIAKDNGQLILREILSSINTANEQKYLRYLKFLEDTHKRRKNRNRLSIIVKPYDEIVCLMDNLRNSLSRLFEIDTERIGLSIIYKFDGQKQYSYLRTVNIDNDLCLDEVINNPKTTLNQIILGKKPMVFFPDKRIGAQTNQYVFGNKDGIFDGIGSILCYDTSVGGDSKFVSAVLSVSTYGVQICSSKDTDAQRKVTENILPSYIHRFKEELAILFIKKGWKLS
jgi:hypothetical protein